MVQSQVPLQTSNLDTWTVPAVGVAGAGILHLLKRAYSNAFAVTSAAYSVIRLPRKLTRVTPNPQIRFIPDLRGSAKSWLKLSKVGRTGDRSLDLEQF
jgi:hypothetical protein